MKLAVQIEKPVSRISMFNGRISSKVELHSHAWLSLLFGNRICLKEHVRKHKKLAIFASIEIS
jgi:hypothetical protein